MTKEDNLSQLPLELGNFQQFDFETFITGENNQLLDLMQQVIGKHVHYSLYLWGEPASGKTHLLQAACKSANESGLAASYIPLNLYQELQPEILHDLGKQDLVCIDDLDLIAKDHEWQQAMTWLYNELRDNQHSMFLTSSFSPTDIKLELSDLKSRLVWDQVVRINPADESTKMAILKNKAAERAFELSDDVIEYLMKRVNRDLRSLLDVLEKIDHASLVEKRKITIPFVRDLIK